MADANASQDGYLKGSKNGTDNQYAYLLGGVATSDNQAAYLDAVIGASDLQSAYLYGTGQLTSSIFAYLAGQVSSSVSAYLEGEMTSYNYIVLTTSDDATALRFRVLSGDYDDGSLEKAQAVVRTVGGGLDSSMGANFKTWNGTIKVRHTEDEADYGDLSELEYFYMLNNPNGTPSNVITFTDNHGVDHEVLLTGAFRKRLLSSVIQGTEAWYIIPIRLERIVNE
jgi:hypothetical protein